MLNVLISCVQTCCLLATVTETGPMKNNSKPWLFNRGSSTPMMSEPEWTETWLAGDSLQWNSCAQFAFWVIVSQTDPWASIWISGPFLKYVLLSVLLLLQICSFGYIVPDPFLPETVHPTRVPVQLNSIAGINLVSGRFCTVNPLLLPCVHDSRLNVKHEPNWKVMCLYYVLHNIKQIKFCKLINHACKPSIPWAINKTAVIIRSHLRITAMTDCNKSLKINQ